MLYICEKNANEIAYPKNSQFKSSNQCAKNTRVIAVNEIIKISEYNCARYGSNRSSLRRGIFISNRKDKIHDMITEKLIILA